MMKMVHIKYLKFNLIIVFYFGMLLNSCSVSENQKKINEIEIDSSLRKLLEEDLRVYTTDYMSNHNDTLFVGVVDKQGEGIEYLRFYKAESIKKDFQYIGYFTCNSFLFLIRDYENKDDNMDLFSLKDEYKYFPITNFETKQSNVPIDKYPIFYKYMNGTLSRD